MPVFHAAVPIRMGKVGGRLPFFADGFNLETAVDRSFVLGKSYGS
jgi:hypothetical protein